MSTKPTLALVTGGTGFVALELIKQLLEKGYSVRTTVRPGSSSDKLEPLRQLGLALAGSLEIVEADLLGENPFHKPVLGVDLVFHVASPFFIESDDPEASLVRPAVRGTFSLFEAVVAAAAAGQPVSRVVLTSSVAAVKGMNPEDPKNGKIYTGEDWNTTSTIANGEAYWLSKTQAETQAWELAKKHNIELVAILPDFIMGPVISTHSAASSTSVSFLKAILEGGPASGSYTFVDVRTVARAHIRAAEVPEAVGRRFIVAQEQPTRSREVTDILKRHFPNLAIKSGEYSALPKYLVDPSPARDILGVNNPPIEETLVDMARTLLALGLVKEPVQSEQRNAGDA